MFLYRFIYWESLQWEFNGTRSMGKLHLCIFCILLQQQPLFIMHACVGSLVFWLTIMNNYCVSCSCMYDFNKGFIKRAAKVYQLGKMHLQMNDNKYQFTRIRRTYFSIKALLSDNNKKTFLLLVQHVNRSCIFHIM